MAQWQIRENRKGSLDLNYRNKITGQTFYCGELRRDTPRRMIVEWVANQNPNPGDVIRFSDGLAFVVQFNSAQA